ncbi:MAG: hypothetical protein A2X49_09950 [Lentisphaerae bacterium GWF2_52_8]|nr:MAG: hypothetical protein A2X49_09950 [Lentisphaerae bacterium GWF2_52_8]
MKLASYGRREWLGSAFIALFLLLISLWMGVGISIHAGLALATLTILGWLALAAFFRDPERKPPADLDVILSPADGVVRDIELVRGTPLNEFFGGKSILRIGIFLSVFDVHLNRAPCCFKVAQKDYREGAFHDARNPLASQVNEAMTLSGFAEFDGRSFPLAIRQISGAIARRIVCTAEPGDLLERAQRYGMIKFGSRTELYLPAGHDISLSVKVGDRVAAGVTVMARLVPLDESSTLTDEIQKIKDAQPPADD